MLNLRLREFKIGVKVNVNIDCNWGKGDWGNGEFMIGIRLTVNLY